MEKILRISYKINKTTSHISTVLSSIIFKNGFADFETIDGNKHIPVTDIIQIANIKMKEHKTY